MDWLLLIAFIAVCELVGISGSVFTVRAIPGWYARLRKPSFNPPNWIFGPVWTLLYALQGIAAYLVFRAPAGAGGGFGSGGFGLAFDVFIVQLALNAAWTPLFFGAKRIGAALAELIVLLAAIIATIALFFGVSTTAGWFMIPYAAWTAFATALNYKIWRLNRQQS